MENLNQSPKKNEISSIYLKIYGMPCVNHCKHCYAFGAPGKPAMKFEDILFILQKAAELKKDYPFVLPQYFEEPTIHPQFTEMFEYQAEAGMVWPGFFFPTNGFGLARMNNEQWRRLKKAGLTDIQLTFYGWKDNHDAFAGRKGAFQDLLETAKKADEHDIGWYAGIIIHTGNVDKLGDIKSRISEIGRNGAQAGCFPFHYQGRGAVDDWRIREADIVNTPLKKELWKSERQYINEITNDDEAGKKFAVESACQGASFDINVDMDVLYGGDCDSAPFPELRPYLKIGSLKNECLASMIKKAVNDPPLPFKILQRTNRRELAEQYGDEANDRIYWLNDLIVNKWGRLHLKKTLDI